MEHDISGPNDPPSGGSLPFPASGGSLPFPASVRAVVPWLRRARELGFLGPGPLEPQVTHALGFAEAIGEAPDSLLDLGTGGGLPGLVLLALWPETTGVLLDSHERRTAFVTHAVASLRWAGRVEVHRSRAEEAGRDPRRRGRTHVVTSRGFGPPAAVAECAAPLLRVGGLLVVSEPPPAPEGESQRWPVAAVRTVGLESIRVLSAPSGTFHVLEQAFPCPEDFPRRVGIPNKRPLW